MTPRRGSSPRVVLLVPAFPKLSETFVVRQYLGLRRRGWDVHVLCNHAGYDHSPEAEWGHFPELGYDDRQRVHPGWPTSPRTWAALLLPILLLRCLLRRPGRTLGWLRRARQGPDRPSWLRVLRRFYIDAELLLLGPDLLHFEFGTLAVERLEPEALSTPELLGCRTVVSFRGFDLNYAGLERQDFYAPVWERAHGLHFLGEDLRDRARRRGWAGDTPHALVPPAVDGHRFEPGPDRAEDPSGAESPVEILSVARLEWKKGHEDALVALALLAEAGVDFRFTLVGEGELRPALHLAVHQLGLGDRVRLLGSVPHAQVRRHLAETDIFLHLALSEGFCNAVLEAQAMAVPVVASDADGLAENVVDGQTGLVVPRRNPEAARDALLRLARDPELRRSMGRAGRERVLEHFRPEAEIDAFEELYRQVLTRQVLTP